MHRCITCSINTGSHINIQDDWKGSKSRKYYPIESTGLLTGGLREMLTQCSMEVVMASSDMIMARLVRCTAEDLSEMEERVFL